MLEIGPNVFSVGVLNPNMRVFDVIMHTEYGTSYNSYLVKGTEKIAVIEGTHEIFLEPFNEHINRELAGRPVDYLVLNHTEPDHTGSVGKFIQQHPDVTILCSPAAGIYIKNITNRTDLKIQVVKDGDKVDLGGKTLEFISAPFLHWPDSMFTYLPEDEILFTCDFLGAHFCEPTMVDARIPEKYKEAYWESLSYYYECIFEPFTKFVVSGLHKIKDLSFHTVCTSHGPILTREGVLDRVLELYQEWSSPKPKDALLIPLFYCTAYEGTRRLAERIQEGILKELPHADVETFNIIDHDLDFQRRLMNDSDAFLLGTLTINRDAVPPLWELLAGMDGVNIVGRPVALFGSFGWSGEAFPNITARLDGVKAKVYPEAYKINLVPSPEELDKAEDFGVAFARSLKKE